MKDFLKGIGIYAVLILLMVLILMMIGNLADNDNIVGYVFSFIEDHITLSIILIVIIVWIISEIIKSRKE